MAWKTMHCDGCDRPHPVTVMVRDALWLTVAPRPESRASSGVLCFACIESRLGRPLAFADLRPCAATDEMVLGAVIAARTGPPPDDMTEFVGFHPERRVV